MGKELLNNQLSGSAPAPMPVDRQVWAKQLNLCNFVNSYYYDIKIGFLHLKNVSLIQAEISKPWSHL